ncbi:MAG: hypothetical protein U5L74_00245 [Ideonella sp.]|nr:hypothetical protein [Ideonella sp.]
MSLLHTTPRFAVLAAHPTGGVFAHVRTVVVVVTQAMFQPPPPRA